MECASLDGLSRRTLVSDNEHYFGIEMTTNYLYLTAWTSKLVEINDDMCQLLVLDYMNFKVSGN